MPEPIIYVINKCEKTRWGWWKVTDHPVQDSITGNFIECHKDIGIEADASLSLQIHLGRGETYVGISGVTHVCVNGVITALTEGEVLYIPRGGLHFSWNESDQESVFHEIQAGQNCDEADIMRSADKYKSAEGLDSDDDVIDIMVKVAKDRDEKGEFPCERNDLLLIYQNHKGSLEIMRGEMSKVLQECIKIHQERTPTPRLFKK